MNHCRCSTCQCEIHTRIEAVKQRDYSPEMISIVEVAMCGCDDGKVVTRCIRVPKNHVPDGWL